MCATRGYQCANVVRSNVAGKTHPDTLFWESRPVYNPPRFQVTQEPT